VLRRRWRSDQWLYTAGVGPRARHAQWLHQESTLGKPSDPRRSGVRFRCGCAALHRHTRRVLKRWLYMLFRSSCRVSCAVGTHAPVDHHLRSADTAPAARRNAPPQVRLVPACLLVPRLDRHSVHLDEKGFVRGNPHKSLNFLSIPNSFTPFGTSLRYIQHTHTIYIRFALHTLIEHEIQHTRYGATYGPLHFLHTGFRFAQTVSFKS